MTDTFSSPGRSTMSRVEKCWFWPLLIWSLVMMAPDILRLTGDFYSFRFSLDNSGKVYQVTDPPDGITLPVFDKEQVDLRQTSNQSLLWFLAGQGGVQIQPVKLSLPLVVVEADGTRRTITVENYAIGPLLWQQQIAMLAEWLEGLIFVALAAFLVWGRPSPMTWGLFLYSLWFNPGPYEVFYAWIAFHPLLTYPQELLQTVAQAVGYGGFLIFALYFPDCEISARGQRFKRLIPIIVVVVGALQLIGFFNTLGLATEWIVRASYVCGWAVDVFALYILREKSKWQAPEQRQRTRWVLLGGCLGLSGYILADSYNATSFWDLIDLDATLKSHHLDRYEDLALAILYSFNMIFAATIFYAVIRHRVKDVSFFVSRTVAIGLAGLAVAVPIEYVVHWTDEELGGMRVGNLIQFAVVLMLSLVLKPVHEYLKHYCDQKLYPGIHHLRASLRDFEARCDSVRRLPDLAGYLSDRPLSALRLVGSAFLVDLSEAKNFGYRYYTGRWQANTVDATLDIAQLERAFAKDDAVVRAPTVMSVDRLSVLGPPPQLGFPVRINGELRGIVLYGEHASGAAFLAEEIDLLRRYVDESVRVLAQIYIDDLEIALQRRKGDPAAATIVPNRRLDPAA